LGGLSPGTNSGRGPGWKIRVGQKKSRNEKADIERKSDKRKKKKQPQGEWRDSGSKKKRRRE